MPRNQRHGRPLNRSQTRRILNLIFLQAEVDRLRCRNIHRQVRFVHSATEREKALKRVSMCRIVTK